MKTVFCDCGEATVVKKVLKEGPNKGRRFHCCAKMLCRFFKWADRGSWALETVP
jgi:DNA topoisomerase-3